MAKFNYKTFYTYEKALVYGHILASVGNDEFFLHLCDLVVYFHKILNFKNIFI